MKHRYKQKYENFTKIMKVNTYKEKYERLKKIIQDYCYIDYTNIYTGSEMIRMCCESDEDVDDFKYLKSIITGGKK